MLNSRISLLHSKLPIDPHAQAKIDAHLIAAAVAISGERPFMPLESLVLLPEDAPQLGTLPDLGPVIRDCLVARRWTTSYLAYCLHQCMPCPRPSVKAPDPDRNSCCVLFNVLLATLLGLYPTSLKRPPFAVRAVLFMRIHSLLTADPDSQAQFAREHASLLVFSLAEYVCHVTRMFMPAEYESICGHFSVDAFFVQGPGAFDAFRQARKQEQLLFTFVFIRSFFSLIF